MDTNIMVFHIKESWTLAFHGLVKLECWNRILNPLDDMSKIAMGRVVSEGIFDYDYTSYTKNSIIGCLSREKVYHDLIIQLCNVIFQSTRRKGPKNVVRSMDKKMHIPLPERYMASPPGSFELDTAYRQPLLIICESLAFYTQWPKMEVSIRFLLH